MKKGMISFILALSLLIPLLSPLSVLAKDESASPTTPETQTLPMAEETTAPAAPVEPDAVSEAELLADCAILKYVDAETFRAAGHVARLPELETIFIGYFAVSPWSNMYEISDPIYCYIRGYVVLYDDLMELLASYYLGNPNITNAVLLSMICTYYASMEVNAQCGE